MVVCTIGLFGLRLCYCKWMIFSINSIIFIYVVLIAFNGVHT